MSGSLGQSTSPGPLGRYANQLKRFELLRTAGSISTVTSAFRVYNDSGEDLEIVSARASLGTACAGSTFLVDINKAGTTIFTTQTSRVTIADGANTGQNAAAPDIVSWANGTYLTADVDQVGSGTAGSTLVVEVWAKPATPA